MKIKDIKFKKIEFLYNKIYSLLQDDLSTGKSFRHNFSSLLSTMDITMELSEVSEIEYIYLKLLSSKITNFYPSTASENDYFVKNNFNLIYNQYIYLNNMFLEKEKEIFKMSNHDVNLKQKYMPAAFLTGECNVDFTGYQLSSFLNNDPISFFSTLTNNECIEIKNGKRCFKKDFPITSDIYMEKIENLFVSYFYKSLTDTVVNRDILSDALISDILHSHNELVLMYNIKNINNTNTKDNIEIQILFNTSLITFFEIFRVIPKEALIMKEDLMSLSIRSDKVKFPELPSLLKNYNVRITRGINDLISSIDSNYNNSNNIIKKLLLSMNYVNYKYSISLTISDIEKYFYNFNIDDNNISSIELKKVITAIKDKVDILKSRII